MKTVFMIPLLVVISFVGFSCRQDPIPNELLPRFDRILEDPIELTSYKFSDVTPFKHIALPLEFGSDRFQDSIILKQLENTHIKYITYVYSDFKADPNFEQQELNRERLFRLYQSFPDVFDSTRTEWNVYEQTEAESELAAKTLFHGFVIHFRPVATKESMESEIEYVKTMLDTAIEFIAPISDSTSLITTVMGEMSDAGEWMYYEGDVTFGVSDSVYTSDAGTFDYGNYFKDTTVSAVLNRNDHWSKMLIHCDLTGSMSPYSAQLFVWHRLNMDETKVQHFVFFNDGNSKPDKNKRAGSTGGIYYSRADNFDQLKEEAFKCMRNGGGGDAPENDVEAILSGLKKCEDCGDIVLVADNWANMRDYKFIDKVHRPIRIILCGTQFGINKQYLNLARATGGSVHTIEEDIDHLMDLKEGEEILISGQRFVIKSGKFVEIKTI
mgnify:CR=1 FL=1